MKSTPEAGTTVHVELPKPRPANVLSKGFEASAFRANAHTRLGPEPSGLVLYVEDNPVNVLVVKAVLRRWPAVQLVVAEDGKSGVEQAKALRPDVVLLDMRLPDMSGLEVLRALRGDAATSDLRVVALSASAMPDEVSVARAAGAQDYWTKPIEVESFCEGMRQLLQEGQLH